jgi:prepilin-type N-terminal cleavage/methylation domain-containing protein
MRIFKDKHSDGFTLVELMMVMAIVGALASFAIPNYRQYQLKALAAQCHSNRYHIEQDESIYFIDNDTASLNIDKRYSCPSGGVYVWLISDPEDPRYPEVACSVHYAGVDAPSQAATESEPPETEDTTPTAQDVPESEPTETEDTTPTPTSAQSIDDLISYISDINLPKGADKKLVSKLNNTKKALEKDDTKKAIKEINNFIKEVKKAKKITTEEADTLVSKAQSIIDTI